MAARAVSCDRESAVITPGPVRRGGAVGPGCGISSRAIEAALLAQRKAKLGNEKRRRATLEGFSRDAFSFRWFELRGPKSRSS